MTKSSPISKIIDPLLLEGKMTPKQIAAHVEKRLGNLNTSKDLLANVRARMFLFRKKGFTTETDEKGNVKVTQKR